MPFFFIHTLRLILKQSQKQNKKMRWKSGKVKNAKKKNRKRIAFLSVFLSERFYRLFFCLVVLLVFMRCYLLFFSLSSFLDKILLPFCAELYGFYEKSRKKQFYYFFLKIFFFIFYILRYLAKKKLSFILMLNFFYLSLFISSCFNRHIHIYSV